MRAARPKSSSPSSVTAPPERCSSASRASSRASSILLRKATCPSGSSDLTGWVPFTPDAAHQGSDPRLAGSRLTIDLRALADNYRLLAARAAPARTAGVVKSDGYGLGAEQVGRALWNAGCRTFFVALPEEGVALRSVLPEAEIFVLNGLF